MTASDRALTYVGTSRIDGPLLVVEKPFDVGYDETVEIQDPAGGYRLGRVLEISEAEAIVQVLEGTEGLSNQATRVRFLGKTLELPVATEMLGRVFDGLGRPLDGGPVPLSADLKDVNGAPINPYSRQYPREFIQTGLSAIDGMNALVRGQKLPIFSGSGLPHDRLAAQIVSQATLIGEQSEFSIVFAAMGVKHDVAQFFVRSFEASGVLANVAMFLSLASAPSIERLLTPRAALTLAEHLAFDLGRHVLVLMTDMTNYCEALREIGAARGEIPGRKGYPGYLYSDLAEIYERAGRIKTSPGSITQMAILSMPADDISHPVPDLTGYITEGQIVLGRELFQRGVYPPIAGLPSLSRLMKDGIGEEELSVLDKQYVEFGERFEMDFLRQGENENRSIEQTLDLGWKVLSTLPRSELHRLSEALLDEHYRPSAEVSKVDLESEPAGARPFAIPAEEDETER